MTFSYVGSEWALMDIRSERKKEIATTTIKVSTIPTL